MYLEAARFLRMRIRSLVDSCDDGGADRPGGGEEDDEYDNDVSYLVNEGEESGEASCRPARGGARARREGGRRIHRPDSGSGRLPPGRVADGALGRLAFFLSEARPIASSAAKDVDDARLWLRWAEISQQMADASTSSSVDAVRVIGDTVAHLHPPAGVEAHSSAPPTRPYVDIDGADATLDVARSIIAQDPR